MIILKLLINKQYLEIKEALTYKYRLIGLIGKTNINYGMYFPKCNSIHTFFMKEAIDVIGLNENQEIIFLEPNLKPNKLVFIHHSLKKTSILELPNNTSQSLKLGDKLFLEFEDII